MAQQELAPITTLSSPIILVPLPPSGPLTHQTHSCLRALALPGVLFPSYLRMAHSLTSF